MLLPDFSGLTENDRMNSPHIQISTTEIDMSTELQSKSKVKQDITITNTGHSLLRIGKLQVFSRAVNADIKNTKIAPGESVPLRVTVNKKDIRPSSRMSLLIISNDPDHTMEIINIKTE